MIMQFLPHEDKFIMYEGIYADALGVVKYICFTHIPTEYNAFT